MSDNKNAKEESPQKAAEYFVSNQDVHGLQSELNALISRGYTIESIFHIGTHTDGLPQFTVVAKRLILTPPPESPSKAQQVDESDLIKTLRIVRADIERRLNSDDICNAPFDEDLSDAVKRIDVTLEKAKRFTPTAEPEMPTRSLIKSR